MVELHSAEVGIELPGPGERNLASFLRDYDSNGIGVFGNTQSGPMAGSEGHFQTWPGGQGQDAAGSDDQVTLNNHSAVMGGRMGPEEGDQQFPGNLGVEFDSAFEIVSKPGLAFQHDQAADVLVDQGFRRGADFFQKLRFS